MFWQPEPAAAERTAIYDAASARSWSYAELFAAAAALSQDLQQPVKQLAFLACDASAANLIAYLALLQSGHAVYLYEASLAAELQQELLGHWQPGLLIQPQGLPAPRRGERHSQQQGLEIWRLPAPETVIHSELALLLSTSGSTGSPRLVRLSYANLQSNAEAIARYLALEPADRAVTSLPLSYSYGLSVVNSHLQVRASLVCSSLSLMQRPFWDLLARQGVTSLAGVPYSYQLMHRLRLYRQLPPSIKTLTQAGGRLDPELKLFFHQWASERGARFYSMYGQTEATARIAYLPPELLPLKPTAIGIAIPGGRLSLQDRQGLPVGPGQSGELIYEGPNVMLGYASARADLALGDRLQGRLATGDLGSCDAEGCFYLSGRLKRFAKLFGLRLNLDELEARLEQEFSLPVACLEAGPDRLGIFVGAPRAGQTEAIAQRLQTLYQLHPQTFTVTALPSLPLTASGKKDYPALLGVQTHA